MKVFVKLIVPEGITLEALRDELENQRPFKAATLKFQTSPAGTLTITMSHDL